MSAYGKGCSNAIYGKANGPYISKERLKTMIDYDYRLLVKRDLTEDEKPKGKTLPYFTFANTVEIGSRPFKIPFFRIGGYRLNHLRMESFLIRCLVHLWHLPETGPLFPPDHRT